MLFKKEKRESGEPKFAVAIQNTVNSEIYKDLLKENNIPFICRNQGAGGYMKILTGGFLVTDNFYVNEKDLAKAKELYDMYVDTKESIEDNEE